MTPADLARLRTLAEQATKGPWTCEADTWITYDADDIGPTGVCYIEHEATRVYVAAVSPDVVMGLLDALEQAAELPRRIREAIGVDDEDVADAVGRRERVHVRECEALEKERDRLAARVLHLEAPGECQSLHKLRAEVERVEAERDAALADSATAVWPRVGVCLECCVEVTTCDEDGAHSCGGYVVVCAGKDSAEQAIEFANKLRAEHDAALVAVEEFLRWQAAGPKGCPPYASAIAHPLTRLDESFAALRTVEDALRAERDELAAEVAAQQGLPHGALPGWTSTLTGAARVWSREFDGDTDVRLVVRVDAGVVSHASIRGGDPSRVDAAIDQSAGPVAIRAAMRAAEAAARSRGWP